MRPPSPTFDQSEASFSDFYSARHPPTAAPSQARSSDDEDDTMYESESASDNEPESDLDSLNDPPAPIAAIPLPHGSVVSGILPRPFHAPCHTCI